VEKYRTDSQVVDENIIRLVRFICRITMARIQTQSQNIYYVLLFQGKNGKANAPQCYVIRKLPVLYNSALLGCYRMHVYEQIRLYKQTVCIFSLTYINPNLLIIFSLIHPIAVDMRDGSHEKMF
jgi:hypothetical protein